MKTKPKPRITGGVELTLVQAEQIGMPWRNYWRNEFEFEAIVFPWLLTIQKICSAKTSKGALAIVLPWCWRNGVRGRVLAKQAVRELRRRARQLVKENGGDNGSKQ